MASLHLLTFHGIGAPSRSLDPGEDRVWVSRDLFEDIVELVSRRSDVILTFDDGNLSDFETALPALERKGLRGLFFPVATRIGQPGFLGGSELRQLASAGMEIGSHGLRHRCWRRLSDDEAHEELTVARKAIEDWVGRPVRSAACPFGGYDRRTLGALRRLGYERVYTSDGGVASSGSWLNPRTTVLAAHDAAAIEHLLGTRFYEPLQVARHIRQAVKRWL
jgi:peptidoglycan/xylan/chitin deacetylase (PgdA/CDA1 family)